MVEDFYHFYGSHIKRWRGFRLCAVDGSSVYLLNRKDVMEHFGTHESQHYSVAMGRVMQLQDVLNDITVWGDIYPVKVPEKAIIASRIPYLPEDCITLFDRGYPSYGLMYLMMNEEVPRHFIIRCPVSFNKEVISFSCSGKRSKTVEWKPNYKSIAMLAQHGI